MPEQFNLPALQRGLQAEGFVHMSGSALGVSLGEAFARAWPAFAASWDDLGVDRYMADGGRYRRRRHAVFTAQGKRLVRQPDRPHYQSRDYNALNGGIARRFAPILPHIAEGPAFAILVATCIAAFDLQDQSVEIEAHQFRIEVNPSCDGKPTPEGMHRDGVDWVAVFLVARHNVVEGTTRISVDNGPEAEFTLTDTLDAVFIDDRRVRHGVTPVRVQNDGPGWRDVLVLTIKSRLLGEAQPFSS